MTLVFTDKQLQDYVTRLLPDNPPPDKHLAIVADATQDGLGFGLVYKFSTSKMEWNAIAGYEHTWGGDNIVGGKVVGYL